MLRADLLAVGDAMRLVDEEAAAARSLASLAFARRAIDLDKFGAPDTIRTCDLCLRRATLYPAELRVLRGFI
jgi:hypothetical protein